MGDDGRAETAGGIAANTTAEARDAAALARIAEGETEALGDLAGRYEALLLGLSRGLLGGSRGLAEEAVQDVWLRVLRSAGSPASGFRDEAGVKTWLYRITINRCRDIRKRESRRSRREMVSFRLHDTSKTANKESPSERARQDEADASGDALHSAVMALPAVQREAVLLCHHRGLTQTEAAAVLGIPEGTLKGRVRAGLAKLRRALASEQGDGGSGENGADQNTEAGLGDVG